MTGLLTTAAFVGFASADPIVAMAAPIIITLPATEFAGSASGLSDDAETVRAKLRDQPYANAGLFGIRDPSRGWSHLDRLKALIGGKPAEAVERRAIADLVVGVWGPQAVTVRYRLQKLDVSPEFEPHIDNGPAKRINI